MQMFTVPQFIDVEDKIIGPITVRQFIICLSGILLIVLFYKIFTFLVFAVSGILVIAIFGTFAFVKVNGRPFHFFVLNFVQTTKNPRLRVWYHRLSFKDKEVDDGREITEEKSSVPGKPKPVVSRLNELALVADTGGLYRGGDNESKIKLVEE